jgi:hypothetical protein
MNSQQEQRRRRAADDGDPVVLTRRLLDSHGCEVLALLRSKPELPLDLLAVDNRGLPVLVAVATEEQRFEVLLRLMRHESIAPLVRDGARVEVVCWSRRLDGLRQVEVLRLTPDDVAEEEEEDECE